MYLFLKIIQNIYFNIIYHFNRFILKQIGVKLGNNLKIFSITEIENPKSISIGDNVWISKNVSLYACNGIFIGNDVIIAKDVSLISGDHEHFSNIKINKQKMQINRLPIIIGDDVWIGEKAVILKSVNIGNGCVIGAGSIVTKNIPQFCIVAGNPAKIIKKRNSIRI